MEESGLSAIKEQLADYDYIRRSLMKLAGFRSYLSHTIGADYTDFDICGHRELAGGRNNLIFAYRVGLTNTSERKRCLDVCLKYYLPFRREDPQVRWGVPPIDRAKNELEYAQVFQRNLVDCPGIQISLPIDYSRHGGNFLVMPFLSGMRNYNTTIGRHPYDQQIARNLGQALATLHRQTTGMSPNSAQRALYVQRMRYRLRACLAQTETDQAMHSVIADLVSGKTSMECVIHDSFSPANALVHLDGTLTIIDFEFSTIGPPAADVGYWIGHVLLQALRTPNLAPHFRDISVRFLDAYLATLYSGEYPLASNLFDSHVTRYIGVTFFHRGVDLPAFQASQIRSLAKAALTNNLTTFSQIWNEMFHLLKV